MCLDKRFLRWRLKSKLGSGLPNDRAWVSDRRYSWPALIFVRREAGLRVLVELDVPFAIPEIHAKKLSQDARTTKRDGFAIINLVFELPILCFKEISAEYQQCDGTSDRGYYNSLLLAKNIEHRSLS